jgi:hypothetical protein
MNPVEKCTHYFQQCYGNRGKVIFDVYSIKKEKGIGTSIRF